jgi:hypothetical protein
VGWWRIDPESGKPAKDARSRWSRPPEFVLLNAVPGVDDDADASYLGDGPWNVAEDMARAIESAMGAHGRLSEAEARLLLMERRIPAAFPESDVWALSRLLALVDEMWKYVDECYLEDWGRPARAAERRWVCEYAVQCLTGSEG